MCDRVILNSFRKNEPRTSMGMLKCVRRFLHGLQLCSLIAKSCYKIFVKNPCSFPYKTQLIEHFMLFYRKIFVSTFLISLL